MVTSKKVLMSGPSLPSVPHTRHSCMPTPWFVRPSRARITYGSCLGPGIRREALSGFLSTLMVVGHHHYDPAFNEAAAEFGARPRLDFLHLDLDCITVHHPDDRYAGLSVRLFPDNITVRSGAPVTPGNPS